MNVSIFEKYALAAAAAIFENSTTAIMVGGTGLYSKAFCEGIDIIPAVDPAVREEVLFHLNTEGIQYLQKELRERDPVFWKIAEQQNPYRLVRALEVLLSTGKSITTFRSGKKSVRPFVVKKIGLEVPRIQLYEQINRRVDEMIDEGLVKEVEQLLPFKHINALQTVGYKELFDYFDGRLSLSAAIERIKVNTRHYAKRQLTWFKKDPEIYWINPTNEDAMQLALEQLSPGSDL